MCHLPFLHFMILKTTICVHPYGNLFCEGYVFTGVCLSRGGCRPCTPPATHTPATHVCPYTTHSPCHACPMPRTPCHACPLPCTSPAMHAPSTQPAPSTHSPRYYEMWSMSGRYASYWNAFLLLNKISILKFYV